MNSDSRNNHSNITIEDGSILAETSFPERFTILSPTDSTAATTTENHQNYLLPSSPTTQQRSVALCVDDSALNRKFIGRFLEKYFSTVHYFINGLEAVEFVEKSFLHSETISIIFMDNVMPIMNGLEATTKIRSLGYTGPIVGVTGNCLPEQIDEFLGHGASIIIQKPITLESFRKVVGGMFLFLFF